MRSNSCNSIVNVKMLAPCFITFKMKDTEKTMRNISPFYMQKELDGITVKVKKAS
jgi:hypothetical protein